MERPKTSAVAGLRVSNMAFSVDVGCRVEIQLDLLTPVERYPAIMPLSWDFSAYWFASFGDVERRQPEERRDRRSRTGRRIRIAGYLTLRSRYADITAKLRSRRVTL
jgi:hypothetical protein